MKRIAGIILLLMFAMSGLTACSNLDTKSSASLVKICNYSSCTFADDVFSVTKDDLETVISMKLNVVDDETDDDIILTDETAMKYFGVKNSYEAKKTFIKEIIEQRVYEEVYAYIINNSVLLATEKADVYVEEIMAAHEEAARRDNLTLDEYIYNSFESSSEEVYKSLYDFYYEMQIVSQFLKDRGIIISEADRKAMLKNISIIEGITEEEVAEKVDGEYIDYLVGGEAVKEQLISEFNHLIETKTNNICTMLVSS